MPLFEINNQKIKSLERTNFNLEKELQKLIEENLNDFFNCRLIKSEFSTGSVHLGRIDTLAISEDNNPVIIEYKKVESSELVNQSLYYLSWLKDHKGDYEIVAQKTLGNSIKVDWSEIRVICIAPNYKKFDLHAVGMMGANIELWTYHLYDNKYLYLEKTLQTTTNNTGVKKNKSNMSDGSLEANNDEYSFEAHVEKISELAKEIALATQDYILNLDSVIQESPKKFYVTYKNSQNIICMETHKNKIVLFLKLEPKTIENPPENSRDVSKIGHYGTGNFELTLKKLEDVEIAKKYIHMAYLKVGG